MQGAEAERAPVHMDPLLSQLQQQSMELGRVALIRCRDHKPQPTACTLDLLKQLEQLKQQKFQLENRIKAGEISTEDFSPENITKEYMTEEIANLQKEIEKLKVAYHNKSLLLRRMQLYDAIHNKLLEKNTESKLIHETIEHSRGLCNQILKFQKENLPLEEQLIEVRKKRMKLKETCTTVMTELKAMKESENTSFAQMDDQKLKSINKYIAKEIDMVTMIQNVFQRMILGTRVNWAEDPELTDTVLKLGKNLTNL
ncbi:centromere protein H [Rhinoderma darwinii]|uniref:centromere protein H n=1 Tax=Rhinoderma darwinii TaxID=43563 RepID=UPI003F664D60